ncbi:MAG: hypothetical protein ACO2OZ_01525 [Acidilobaceae archaeon]
MLSSPRRLEIAYTMLSPVSQAGASRLLVLELYHSTSIVGLLRLQVRSSPYQALPFY